MRKYIYLLYSHIYLPHLSFHCRFAFSETLKRMYGIKHDLNSLPPMPEDGGTWSVMQSWALPTKSFLEFVMFSRLELLHLMASLHERFKLCQFVNLTCLICRMFVDALDAQMYDEHHQSGHCYLSFSKVTCLFGLISSSR